MGKLGKVIAGIGRGKSLLDKILIGLMLARYGLLPAARLGRRFGLRLQDPASWISYYTCRTDEGLSVRCPGGGPPLFLFFDQTHDIGVRRAIETLTAGTFIDVGAHVGFFALPAAKRLGRYGHVVAFEPHPRRFRFLSENVKLNGLANVTCVPWALGDGNDTLILHDLDSSLTQHSLDVGVVDQGGKPFRVPMRTLDSLRGELPLEHLAMVKLDVEGFEPQVLAGMRETLLRHRPVVIFEALTQASLTASSEELQGLDYEITQVDRLNYMAKPRLEPGNGGIRRRDISA